MEQAVPVEKAEGQAWLDKHGLTVAEDGKFNLSDRNTVADKIPHTIDEIVEHIKQNVLLQCEGLEDEPYDDRTFVMCCGGPSLADGVEEIREMVSQPDKYLVVCSNQTAKYLLAKSIVPHVHFILDPKANKAEDLSETRPEIEYWIGLGCHPAVFAKLAEAGIKPKVFLALGDKEGREVKAVQDAQGLEKRRINCIQGGTMAGLRAINLADLRGFRKMIYFGFDASVMTKGDSVRHYSYTKVRPDMVIELDCDRCGEKFDSTIIFSGQVNEFINWSQRMPWMDIEMRGSGLMQHYYDHIRLEAAEKSARRPEGLYSQEYANMQKMMHAEHEGDYGRTGALHVSSVYALASQLLKRHGSVRLLDYGSSWGGAFTEMSRQFHVPEGMTFEEYDPFVVGKENAHPADFVLCADVMEHVEPEYTENVLDHIARLVGRVAFFSISLVPAKKLLPDGRNAHINLRTPEYWLTQLRKRFITSEAKHRGGDILVVVQSIDAVRRTLHDRRNKAAEWAAAARSAVDASSAPSADTGRTPADGACAGARAAGPDSTSETIPVGEHRTGEVRGVQRSDASLEHRTDGTTDRVPVADSVDQS